LFLSLPSIPPVVSGDVNTLILRCSRAHAEDAADHSTAQVQIAPLLSVARLYSGGNGVARRVAGADENRDSADIAAGVISAAIFLMQRLRLARSSR
jgi:hypothetical protein